ncbi:MAG: isopentenyl phosphate kinase [Thermoproteota archaeon]|nr:isopentenyl phosphate kinase [Thermoproteota archaeon]
MDSELALIKLGGSVVTHKELPLSANESAITMILRTLSSVKMPKILIHGGGSFGHYWSVKYDMHSKPDVYSPRGIANVHESMISLNEIIVKLMVKSDMNPYSLAPSALILKNKPILQKIRELQSMANGQIIPVTFGDVVYRGNRKYSILSGDELMTLLSTVLRPKKIIFALNVDGILSDLKSRRIIKCFDGSNVVKFGKVEADVTGGMKRKVREALKIASLGLDVWLVNGFKPKRIARVLDNLEVEGTVIKGKRGNTWNA